MCVSDDLSKKKGGFGKEASHFLKKTQHAYFNYVPVITRAF